MAVDWGYYDKFESLNDKYLPFSGEGETVATQIVTAVNKLVYKWYNDGDVFDNTHHLEGWANDLSSYANWLYENTKDAWKTLNNIVKCYNGSDYEDLLKELADKMFDAEFLAEQNKLEKIGTVYDCDGKFKYEEKDEDDDDDDNGYWYDDDDEDEEYEED